MLSWPVSLNALVFIVWNFKSFFVINIIIAEKAHLTLNYNFILMQRKRKEFEISENAKK